MRLKTEDQILSREFRIEVIKEIEANENLERKKNYYKRYEIYKDRVLKYIEERLKAEGLKPSTIQMMMNRAGNISFARKAINKLARSYAAGVLRSGENDAETEQLQELAQLLDFNQKMKKADKYRELYKNCMTQVVPEVDNETGLYCQSLRVLSPWQYDVIEDANDREIPRVVILSEFTQDQGAMLYATEEEAAIHSRSANTYGPNPDGVDNIIADNPSDASKGEMKTYIWWSDKYHFTTNKKGDILANLSPDDLANPIEMLPFRNIAEDQDGYFWAEGGDDLIDGSILLNHLITDMNSISYMQGYGQLVITGKNLPERYTMGPHQAILFDYDPSKEEPKPEVTVVSANPPLESWMKSIEQYAALLLSTNNLSPATIAMKLDAAQFPSGIAMLVEMSEANNEIADTQKMFSDAEKYLWKVVKKWHNLFLSKNLLEDEYKEIGPVDEEAKVNIKFMEAKPVISEKEKLEAMKLRKELGVSSMADLIAIDDPSMTKEEAKQKMLEISEERRKMMAASVVENGEPVEDSPEDEKKAEVDGE